LVGDQPGSTRTDADAGDVLHVPRHLIALPKIGCCITGLDQDEGIAPILAFLSYVAKGLAFGEMGTVEASPGFHEVALIATGNPNKPVLSRKVTVPEDVPTYKAGQTIFAVNPLDSLTLTTLAHDIPSSQIPGI